MFIFYRIQFSISLIDSNCISAVNKKMVIYQIANTSGKHFYLRRTRRKNKIHETQYINNKTELAQDEF